MTTTSPSPPALLLVISLCLPHPPPPQHLQRHRVTLCPGARRGPPAECRAPLPPRASPVTSADPFPVPRWPCGHHSFLPSFCTSSQ